MLLLFLALFWSFLLVYHKVEVMSNFRNYGQGKVLDDVEFADRTTKKLFIYVSNVN